MEEMKILYITRGYKNSSSTMGIFWQFLIKIEIYLAYNPAISLLIIYLKEMKTYVSTKICMWIFIASLFIIAPSWIKN